MYHPDKYIHHNNALDKFCAVFNDASATLGDLIHMKPSPKENFREDGEITFKPKNTRILYDFEKRFSYYDHYKMFKFDTFGQFERKIQKPEISLSIQCSKNEDGFMIAWHEDYRQEKIAYINSKTANGWEQTGKRFTKKYSELAYNEMERFYKILDKAFTDNRFNASCFDL